MSKIEALVKAANEALTYGYSGALKGAVYAVEQELEAEANEKLTTVIAFDKGYVVRHWDESEAYATRYIEDLIHEYRYVDPAWLS